MKIDITSVVSSINRSTAYEASLDFNTFSSRLGDFPLTYKSPISLQVANQENTKLVITGSGEVKAKIPCDRCLKDVQTLIRFEIDEELFLRDGKVVDEESEEPDYLIGLDLDVDKLVYSEILVNWPMKVLCRDDCKGICRVCGKNLNHGTCSCDRTVLDPRMAAIQDIFKQFKEV